MLKLYLRRLIPLLCFQAAAFGVFGQTIISGKVSDAASGGPIPGVNILVKGTVLGTVTDTDGQFSIKVNSAPPLTLLFKYVGYSDQELEITEANTSNLDIKMEFEASELTEVTVTGSTLTEEKVFSSPVSISTINTLGVQSTASDNYYVGLKNLPGLDMTTSSVNFQIINARGFNSTGNTRFVQMTDGMDTQAPALNFPIGNLNGPSELDVQSIEFIPGSSSALYGPNAFNGVLLVNSKDPFKYQGLSAFTKVSVNHIGDSDLNSGGMKIGPGGAQPMYEGALRYAKAFNNRFAFKVAVAYMQATDWYGTNMVDKSPERTPTGMSFNPGADRVHAFGDEVANSLGLVKISLAPAFANTPLAAFANALPDNVVSRTPYEEQYLVDYNAKNLKANVGLHYRLTDKMELLYNLNYGAGTSVYTGAQRYSLKDFNIQQHKIELKGDNFFVRGYTTIENSGDSYIADLTGILVNDAWKSNSTWFRDYSYGYISSLAAQGTATPNAAQMEAAHAWGRAAADGNMDQTQTATMTSFGLVGSGATQINTAQTRYLPGSAEFNQAKANARKQVIPFGSLFDDQTRLYHAQAQYNFKNEIKFMELIAGASYRLYDLNSNGTIFADTTGNDITIQEIGAYLQASKTIGKKLRLIGSGRYDKNENFKAQINPRIAAVYSINENNNFRASFQTGFRLPTTQNQHIDLNAVSARLIGGLPEYARARNVFQNAYELRSVVAYTAAVAQSGSSLALGQPANLALLVPITGVETVKPERVQSIEVGYRSQIGDNFSIDATYYTNTFNDFIAGVFLRKASGDIDISGMNTSPSDQTYLFDPRTEQNIRNAQTLLTPITTIGKENTFSVPTNIDRKLTASGFALSLNYNLPKGYMLGGNYNWNRLKDATRLREDGFLAEFNTPEHKFNFTFGNRKVTENLGFNVAYRWQQSFLWESSFAQGDVPSVGVVDAQVSYRLKGIKSILKVGGSNLTNERYVLNYGGPTLGAIYYVSLTFDQFLNKN